MKCKELNYPRKVEAEEELDEQNQLVLTGAHSVQTAEGSFLSDTDS